MQDKGFHVIDTVKILEERLSHIKTPITLSIIGCVVNGPGEAAMTDIGITGGKKWKQYALSIWNSIRKSNDKGHD